MRKKMSKQSWYLVLGVAAVVVVLLVYVSPQKASTVQTTSLGTWGGLAAGLGNLFKGAGAGYKSAFGDSPSGDGGGYTPNIAHGDDITIGGDA
jgi:hypothetical protein